MPKKPIDWNLQPVSFYKFICEDVNIKCGYVGHTTNFTQRKYSHKTECNNLNNKNYNEILYETIRKNGGWTNWRMIEIYCKLCLSKRDAERIQQEFITQYKYEIDLQQETQEQIKQQFFIESEPKKKKKKKKNKKKKNKMEIIPVGEAEETEEIEETEETEAETEEAEEEEEGEERNNPNTKCEIEIVFNACEYFKDKQHIIYLINDLYNRNDLFYEFMMKYIRIMVIRDIHFDNNNMSKSLHFTAKFSNFFEEITPSYHFYIKDKSIHSLTIIHNILI